MRQLAQGTSASAMAGPSAATMPMPVLPRESGRPLTAATVTISGTPSSRLQDVGHDLRAPVLRIGARDADRGEQPALGLEPAIGGEHLREAAHQQAGADEQHQ